MAKTKSNLGRPVLDQFVSIDALEALLGVKQVNLKQLGIESRVFSGVEHYKLNEVTRRSKRSIAAHFTGRVRTGQTMGKDSIRRAKLVEGARKLQLANDQVEAGLVDKERFEMAFADKLETIKSIIGEIPDLVVELSPDINPKALVIVEKQVADAIRFYK